MSTKEEVIEMAREAGYFLYDLTETHQKKTVETDEADEWAQLERFAKLVADKKEAEMQERIDTLHAMYELVCKQRDELMDQQRAMVAAMRGQIQ